MARGIEVFFGLGSNVGDRMDHLQKALHRLTSAPYVTVLEPSSVVETPAMGDPVQRVFFNAVVSARVDCLPMGLLHTIRRIEGEGGRHRTVRWGPRTIDVDLLAYGQWVIAGPMLQVPHPRMLERSFVMEPLLEICPEWVHPTAGQITGGKPEAEVVAGAKEWS
ncbi:MAG: 2-amino-4-hydroxy-6-hydroxymethyldihydropteridine diphosphokinase [Candidatus Latescibacteria bacterium]|nr:2-amino-4-hydroxy-6-hydroxymethyldihydropteridine diphosphokinase [Candidatus Latescibacterota bacterium]